MSTHDPQIETRGPVAWMAGNSVAANLLMVVVLVGGLFMTRTIKQEVFPDMSADIVTVSVAYPGASPEEVEQGIVLAVEEAVQGLDGIKEISSTASEGNATISIELLEGEDLQQLVEDVKGEIDQITTLPEDAEEPEVAEVSRRREVLSAIVYGDVPERTLHDLVEHLRDELLQDENITQVDLGGVRALEISVEVSQENLQRYGLTLAGVASQIKTSALDLPGGGVKTKGGEILVRVTERRDWGDEFRQLPLISPSTGGEVLLGDIATVIDGYSDTDLWTEYNGKRAMELEVYRIGDQTPLEVAGAVYDKVEELRPSLPTGVGIDIINDRSEMYKQRIELLLKNMSLGLVLVLLILGVFLEARLAFWVMMGIPISFMGALLMMPIMGVSLNMITLFAFIISLGIVVDDAIVIGEGVYYYRQQGMKALPAAIKGARELAMPVVFSVLTNVVAFLPLFFVPGMMGRVFKMIPVVVVSAFLVSLMESLFILPAHLGHQKRRELYGVSKKLHEMQQRFGDRFTNWVNTRYGPFLDGVLKRRYLAISIGLGVLVLSLSFAASGRMGFSLFPQAESDFAIANITLPYGTSVDQTAAAAHRLVRAAEKVRDTTGHPELVEGILTDIGRSGAHTATVRVMLADPDIRDNIMSTANYVAAWRKEVGEIAGVEELRMQSDFGGPGAGKALTVELSHRQVSVLENASADLAEELRNFPTVSDISDGFQAGKQQLDITLKPSARSLGLNASDVARQIRAAFYGSEAMRQQRGRNEVKVMVRLPEEERSSEENIHDLLLMTPAGVQVPLRDVVDIHRDRAFTTITRRDGRRVIQVTGDVTPRSKAGEVIAALNQSELPALAQRYPGLIYSFEGRTAEQRDSMSSLGRGFLFALLGIFALLAIPFRSYIQPLIVMTAIPFGIIGAVAGHLIMGYSLSVISMFGIVALSGVVVNDSLVLIDLANRKRRDESMSVHDSMLASATQRFRPIMLTTLTTFLGLTPMILERAMQARFMIPMAISLGFGILFATAITLLLVPCLYMVAEDMTRNSYYTRNGLRKLRGRPSLPPPPGVEVVDE